MHQQQHDQFIANNPFTLNPMFIATAEKPFIKDLLTDFKAWAGKKRLSKHHKKGMPMLIANIEQARLSKRPILHRLTTSGNNKPIVEMIKYLASINLIDLIIGTRNEYAKKGSWFAPTEEFAYESIRAKIRIALRKGDKFLLLRDKEKNDIGLPKNTKLIKKLSKPAIVHNQLWLRHKATLDGKPINPFVRRIFNKSTALDLGGRFYGGVMSHMYEPQHARSRILIDGEETIELDYKSMHVALLYNMAGIDVFSLTEDPYGKGGNRKLIKKYFVRFINSNNKGRFKAVVTKSGNPSVKKIAEKPRNLLNEGEKDSLKGFISDVPDDTKGIEIVKIFIDSYNEIAYTFDDPDIGLELQFADSEIMGICLVDLAKQNIPVLPIHDSIRCKISDLEKVQKSMLESYEKYTQFKPKIEQK